MFGLDPGFVDTINCGLSLNRIKTDVLTDFILAPHYSVVYTYAADELIERVRNLLRSGAYAPELPIKVDVPKRSGLTRPGAILSPIDRLIYQMLVDTISEQAEAQLNRARVYSYVLLTDDPEFKMFRPGDECWQNMQSALTSLCRDSHFPYAIKADIACYYERIYQHNLINLLHACGCDSRAVNLLEKILLAFTEKDSHGILQGMFPSDFLGNFYLASLDAELEVRGISSVRYVDDLYLFYPSRLEAQKGLVDLCRFLRDEGLNLNESKTKLLQSKDLLAEETQIDRLLNKAKREIREIPVLIEMEYGFQSIWGKVEEVLPAEEVELMAVKEVYRKISDNVVDAERIEKLCLPCLSKALDDIAIGRSLSGVVSRPYLSKLYCTYLRPFAHGDSAISRQLELIIRNDELPYDWSLIWPMAVLIEVNSIASETVNKTISIIEDRRRSDSLRGVAAHLVAKHGSAGQRRLLKHQYDREPSPYVKAAILFSAKHFPTNERNSCLGAWGSHSTINSLIASAIRSGTS